MVRLMAFLMVAALGFVATIVVPWLIALGLGAFLAAVLSVGA